MAKQFTILLRRSTQQALKTCLKLPNTLNGVTFQNKKMLTLFNFTSPDLYAVTLIWGDTALLSSYHAVYCAAVCSYNKFRRCVWLLVVDPTSGKASVYKGVHVVYNNTN